MESCVSFLHLVNDIPLSPICRSVFCGCLLFQEMGQSLCHPHPTPRPPLSSIDPLHPLKRGWEWEGGGSGSRAQIDEVLHLCTILSSYMSTSQEKNNDPMNFCISAQTHKKINFCICTNTQIDKLLHKQMNFCICTNTQIDELLQLCTNTQKDELLHFCSNTQIDELLHLCTNIQTDELLHLCTNR